MTTSRFWDDLELVPLDEPLPQPVTLPSLLLDLRVRPGSADEPAEVRRWLKSNEPNEYLRRDLVKAGYLEN